MYTHRRACRLMLLGSSLLLLLGSLSASHGGAKRVASDCSGSCSWSEASTSSPQNKAGPVYVGHCGGQHPWRAYVIFPLRDLPSHADLSALRLYLHVDQLAVSSSARLAVVSYTVPPGYSPVDRLFEATDAGKDLWQWLERGRVLGEVYVSQRPPSIPEQADTPGLLWRPVGQTAELPPASPVPGWYYLEFEEAARDHVREVLLERATYGGYLRLGLLLGGGQGGLQASGHDEVGREPYLVFTWPSELTASGRNGHVRINGRGQRLPWRGKFAHGERVELAAIPAPGYEFAYWSGDASGTSPTISLDMDRNKKVRAHFEGIRYLKSSAFLRIRGRHGRVKVNGYTYRLPFAEQFRYGDVVHLQAIPDRGYEFARWSGDASGTSLRIRLYMDRDREATARFRWRTEVPSQKRVRLRVSGSGWAEVDGQRRRLPFVLDFGYGDVVRLEAIPDEGYEFAGWRGGASGLSPAIFVVMNGNRYIWASFRAAGKPPVQEPPAGKRPADGPPAGGPPPGKHPADTPAAGEEQPLSEGPSADKPPPEQDKPPAEKSPPEGEEKPPSEEPPPDRLPPEEDKPPAEKPPADRPPEEEDKPPEDKPPSEKPPADERPKSEDEPPAEKPPADKPPEDKDEPPAGKQRAE